jgi:hypothetical protein
MACYLQPERAGNGVLGLGQLHFWFRFPALNGTVAGIRRQAYERRTSSLRAAAVAQESGVHHYHVADSCYRNRSEYRDVQSRRFDYPKAAGVAEMDRLGIVEEQRSGSEDTKISPANSLDVRSKLKSFDELDATILEYQ